MAGPTIPEWATPWIRRSMDHITDIGLAGVCVLAVLYAFKSWRNHRR